MITICIGTSKESDLTLISRPKLTEPPVCLTIPTVGALHSDGRQRANRLGIIDDNDLFLFPFFGNLHLFLTLAFFFPATRGADKDPAFIF